MESPAYEAFYKKQKIVPEEEWDAFIATLRKPLATTFRINGRIHECLKLENEIGSITRQEAVSMIPPLFLDVQPHHNVPDMCAAPGSKTFQLLEMILRDVKPGELSDGMDAQCKVRGLEYSGKTLSEDRSRGVNLTPTFFDWPYYDSIKFRSGDASHSHINYSTEYCRCCEYMSRPKTT